MGKTKHPWPPDHKIAELVATEGSKAKAAVRLGVAVSTLKDHIRRNNIEIIQNKSLKEREVLERIAQNVS